MSPRFNGDRDGALLPDDVTAKETHKAPIAASVLRVPGVKVVTREFVS